MVNHHHVRTLRPGPRTVVETLAIGAVGTTIAQTRVRRRLKLPPDLLLVIHQQQLVLVSRLGAPQPVKHLGEHPRLGGICPPGAAEHPQSPLAQIVASALEHGSAKLEVQRPPQVGDILLHELVLQVDSIGRDHHAAVVLQGKGDGGQQIGQRLAHARASFHHQVIGSIERLRHLTRHLYLLVTVLVSRQCSGKGALRLKERRQGIHVYGLDRLSRLERRRAARGARR